MRIVPFASLPLRLAVCALVMFAPTACGSGGDCVDYLRLDGVQYNELRDVVDADVDDDSPASSLSPDPQSLTRLVMVVAANNDCEGGAPLKDGEATTLPVGTEIFQIDGRTDGAVAAVVGDEVIVFVPVAG